MDDPYNFFPHFEPSSTKNFSPSLPSRFWLVTGNGESNVSPLNAFDAALVNAGIGHLNLIQYSSILPANASISSPPVNIAPGSRTGTILAIAEGEKGEYISAGMAFGEVVSPSPHYVVFEAHGKEPDSSLKKRLELMIQEAISLRQSPLPPFLRVINGLQIEKRYGCSIVAVVFDPTVYS